MRGHLVKGMGTETSVHANDSFGMRNHIVGLTLTDELTLMLEDSFALPS